jgi:AcrR family transcriptional regulator
MATSLLTFLYVSTAYNLVNKVPAVDNAGVKRAQRNRTRGPRARRTAEDARARILDAAEKRLSESGPSALRLQEIAADVGVSHPAILHHFGSREGLLEAVVERAVGALERDLIAAFQSTDGGPPNGSEMLARVSDVLITRGHGRVLAWLLLSGYGRAIDTASARTNWKTIVELMHALRLAAGKKPTHDDTAFVVILPALVLLGQSITGRTIFRMAGVEDADVERRFREWLDRVLATYLER